MEIEIIIPIGVLVACFFIYKRYKKTERKKITTTIESSTKEKTDKEIKKNISTLKVQLTDEDVLNQFKEYLKEAGYSEFTPTGNPSTIYDYCNRVKKVALRENITIFQLSGNIDLIIKKYDKGGKEESFGNKSNRAVINALKSYKIFSNNLKKYNYTKDKVTNNDIQYVFVKGSIFNSDAYKIDLLIIFIPCGLTAIRPIAKEFVTRNGDLQKKVKNLKLYKNKNTNYEHLRYIALDENPENRIYNDYTAKDLVDTVLNLSSNLGVKSIGMNGIRFNSSILQEEKLYSIVKRWADNNRNTSIEKVIFIDKRGGFSKIHKNKANDKTNYNIQNDTVSNDTRNNFIVSQNLYGQGLIIKVTFRNNGAHHGKSYIYDHDMLVNASRAEYLNDSNTWNKAGNWTSTNNIPGWAMKTGLVTQIN